MLSWYKISKQFKIVQEMARNTLLLQGKVHVALVGQNRVFYLKDSPVFRDRCYSTTTPAPPFSLPGK